MAGFWKALFLALVAIAAVVAIGLATSSKADVDKYQTASRLVMVEADLNEENAEGAPQQQVVNGWAARDLMRIQIRQNNDSLAQQQRTNQLLALLVALAAAGVGIVGFVALSRMLGTATSPVETANQGLPRVEGTPGSEAVVAV